MLRAFSLRVSQSISYGLRLSVFDSEPTSSVPSVVPADKESKPSPTISNATLQEETKPGIEDSLSTKITRSFDQFNLIGEGSWGKVYSCRSKKTKELIAIKVIKLKAPKRKVVKNRKVKFGTIAKIYKNITNFTKRIQPFFKIRKPLYKKKSKDDSNQKNRKKTKINYLPKEQANPEHEGRDIEEVNHEITLWKRLNRSAESLNHHPLRMSNRRGNRRKSIMRNVPDIGHYGLLRMITYYISDISNECYILMELCSKGSLYFFVKNFVFDQLIPFTLEIVIYLCAPLFSALRYMHSKGICHLDVKAENIILSSTLTPKLIDFGLSESFDVDGLLGERSQIKIDGTYSGTPSYSPPEAFYGRYLDCSFDVWSMAHVMLFMKFGKVCWTFSGLREWGDEEISKYFGDKLLKKLGEKGEEEVEKDYLSELCVLPKNEFQRKRSRDELKWSDERIEFGKFLKRNMLCWDQKKRKSAREICECEDYNLNDLVRSWDTFPEMSAVELRRKIESWKRNSMTVDEKWEKF